MPTCKIKEFKIKLNSLVLEDMTDRSPPPPIGPGSLHHFTPAFMTYFCLSYEFTLKTYPQTSHCKEIISIYLYILITLTIYNFNKIHVLGNFS